jgi:MEDS: MEthanogen/methylotroph, DcmR Sensory domain
MRQTVQNATPTSGHFHAVRFYESRESLCRIVAEFLGEGLVANEPAVVIGTPEHCAGIIGELRARHFDVNEMQRTSDLVVLDARETMSLFMVDGFPDADLFHAAASEAIERVGRRRPASKIRAYGEMVDLLWQDGHTTAAVRLEMLWNKLAMTHDFSLLCGYSMGNFYKDAGMADICHQHTHVVGLDGTPAPATETDRQAR